ncbi:cryptococcal mannosyltransferase 1-domain-containing protein [Mycena olivaceomarginata]|nr:cryptococcal mannosyltransferase 1-domain-containing protein [Mycena olivaceomarginata]
MYMEWELSVVQRDAPDGPLRGVPSHFDAHQTRSFYKSRFSPLSTALARKVGQYRYPAPIPVPWPSSDTAQQEMLCFNYLRRRDGFTAFLFFWTTASVSSSCPVRTSLFREFQCLDPFSSDVRFDAYWSTAFTSPTRSYVSRSSSPHAASFLLISLGVGFPYAFPLPRTFFVAALISTPLWGLCMSIFYLVWSFAAPAPFLWIWRPHREHYIPLAGEANEFLAGTDKKRHRRPPTALWAVYLFATLCGAYLLSTHELPIDHRFKSTVQLANRVPNVKDMERRIFIAAMFYNNAYVLPYWIAEVSKLINYLGPDNVFVSIVESYSSDDSPALLRAFETKLQAMSVPNRILTHDTSVHRPPSMVTGPLRIDFLAATRNLVLEPLTVHGGYDRVLFSNDVFVEAESIVELLETNRGEYDMACGLDFQQWGLYDIWVIRDHLGRIVSGQWPYFSEESGFAAVMANEPAPHQGRTISSDGNAARRALRAPIAAVITDTSCLPTTRKPNSRHCSTSALPQLFPGRVLLSESFNLPYDLRRLFGLERIYVNPRVITAYKWRFYLWFKYAMRHWVVKWFMETAEHKSREDLPQFVLGGGNQPTIWDGTNQTTALSLEFPVALDGDVWVSETAYTAYAASDFKNNVIAPKTCQNLRCHRFRESIEVEEVWDTMRNIIKTRTDILEISSCYLGQHIGGTPKSRPLLHKFVQDTESNSAKSSINDDSMWIENLTESACKAEDGEFDNGCLSGSLLVLPPPAPPVDNSPPPEPETQKDSEPIELFVSVVIGPPPRTLPPPRRPLPPPPPATASSSTKSKTAGSKKAEPHATYTTHRNLYLAVYALDVGGSTAEFSERWKALEQEKPPSALFQKKASAPRPSLEDIRKHINTVTGTSAAV